MPSGKAKVKIVFAPKLQMLGYLGISVRPLVLHDTVFDVMPFPLLLAAALIISDGIL